MIEYQNIKSEDYNIFYYMQIPYIRTQQLYLSYFTNPKFEATKIIDGIYLGNVESSYDYKKLKELGITHIISVIAGYEPPFPNDFNYLVVCATDSENTELQDVFEKTNTFIDKAFEENGKVLIHCVAGRSRSVTILSVYLIKTFGMDVDKIISIVKEKRDIICPNPGFLKQLNDYYDETYKDSELNC
jgi:protein-tyrosine phosphatase